MTEIDLQNEIKRVLKKNILPELSLFKPNEMKVFLQDIPISTEFEDDDDNEDKYFPCCIVRLLGGRIKTASEPQITTIEIVVGIKDFSKDMSGYQNTVICLDRIRDYFSENVGIHKKFRLVYPIETGINTEVAAPYYFGNIITNWQTDVKPYADIEKFL